LVRSGSSTYLAPLSLAGTSEILRRSVRVWMQKLEKLIWILDLYTLRSCRSTRIQEVAAATMGSGEPSEKNAADAKMASVGQTQIC